METYGITISKITITFAQPPAEFMRSLEARHLAVIQHAEQMERQSLALRRQTDDEILKRQEVVARVEREREQLEILVEQARLREQVVELEAKAEALRLKRLDERLKAFPVAAQFDWKRSQLEVARSLAGNTRAVVQLGDAADFTRAFVWGDMWSDLTQFQSPPPAAVSQAAVVESVDTIEPPETKEQAAEA
jgi:hypothetical protein